MNILADEWYDDFSDKEKSKTEWSGDWGAFGVNKHAQLQSQSPEAGENILLHKSDCSFDAEWRFWVRISGNCSAYNQVRFYLTLTDESAYSDGYYVQIGGANKNITLYEQQSGVATKVIEHSARKKCLSESASYVNVRVTRGGDGVFRLFTHIEGQDTAWVEEGMYFAPMVESQYCAIEVRNSKTRGYDFYIDNIYVSGERQRESLSSTSIEDTTKVVLQLLSDNLSPNYDEWEDEVCIQYTVPDDFYQATCAVYTANGILIKQLCQKEIISSTGTICWDGSTLHTRTAEVGVYVLYIELKNTRTNDTLRRRMAVSLTL